MTSRLKMLLNSTLFNFLAIIFIVGNLSFVIFGNSVAAQVELLALACIVMYAAWFFITKPAAVHTNRWVSRCTCGIFWVTLLAVGFEYTMPLLLWLVLGAGVITFIGFALNESYSSLAEFQKSYVTDEEQHPHIK